MLPFLVLTIFQAVARQLPAVPRWTRTVGIAAVIVVGTGLPRWYWPVVHILSPGRWTTVRVHDTSVWVKGHTPPGARVLTTDIAVPLETGQTVYPEYAVGRHVLHVGPFLSAERRRALRLPWGEELERVLRDRPADAGFFDRRVVGDSAALIDYAPRRGIPPVASPHGHYELLVAPQPGVARWH